MNSGYAIVGRVRKPHGIRGELVVEPTCSEPDAVFAPGRTVFVGDDSGVPQGDAAPIEIVHSRPFKQNWLVGLRGVRDRNDAELWRDRHLLALSSGLKPLDSGEVFLHEIIGMRVVHVNGTAIGEVTGVQTMPHGLLLQVRTADREANIPFVDAIIVNVDRDARVITADPPEGLLELMLRINVVTIFPEFFSAPLGLSIPAKAAAAGSVAYNVVDLRDFTHDRHRTVDDAPYGGGPGMVMKPEPFFEAVESLGASAPIVLLSARGKTFAQDDAVRFANGPELTLLCGHYKDVDQRVGDFLATEELSLGRFVLSGGEAAALVVIDAVARLLPGAMSDGDSFRGDSFWEGRDVSAPSYTRPEEYRGHRVPDVLLSGHHKRIAEWRSDEKARRREDEWRRR